MPEQPGQRTSNNQAILSGDDVFPRPGRLTASTYDAVTQRIEQRIREAGSHLNILEAGCGRRWPFPKGEHRLTGVDIDRAALAIRKRKHGDLDVAIHGDLSTVELPTASYDVIYCSFVLEHLDGAEDVLHRFVAWLKPGGRLVLTFPDRDTVFGFFTRITPLWVHVLYKKYIERIPNAGKPGYPPYPTQYDPVTSRAAFHRFAAANRLRIIDEYSFGWMPRPAIIFCRIVSLLTFGWLGPHKNLCYVLRKRKVV